jgi:hypothetical protein
MPITDYREVRWDKSSTTSAQEARMLFTEYREVRFDAAALRAALQVWLVEMNSRQGKAQPPVATVVAVTVTRADPVQLTLDIASPEGAERCQVVVEAVEVAAALIHACMQRGIRLPRRGAKAVKATQDGVALVVMLAHAGTAAARQRAV